MLKKFESQNGFYRLEYPETYSLIYEENVLNIFPDNNESALTISSYYFDNGIDDKRFAEMFEIFTKNYKPAGDRIEANEDIWVQRFTKQDEDQVVIWTMCLNRNDKVLLVISINFGESEQEEIIDQYQSIFESIENLGA